MAKVEDETVPVDETYSARQEPMTVRYCVGMSEDGEDTGRCSCFEWDLLGKFATYCKEM